MLCPNCNSKKIIKKGKRKTKFKDKQIFYCKTCGKKFTNSIKILQHKTYPSEIIISSLNRYNTGYNIREVSDYVNNKFNLQTSKSTIHLWLKQFEHLCPITCFKKNFLEYDKILFSKNFQKQGLNCNFMYHKYKLDYFVKKKQPGLARYIKIFENGCPNVFFEISRKCSKTIFKPIADFTNANNKICETTRFVTSDINSGNGKHSVGEFLLINDDSTVAYDLPVWYWDKNKNVGMTGKIDLVQVKDDFVYILKYCVDYSEDVLWDLYNEAIALSFRAKINPRYLRCAWFNKDGFYEFEPKNIKINREDNN